MQLSAWWFNFYSEERKLLLAIVISVALHLYLIVAVGNVQPVSNSHGIKSISASLQITSLPSRKAIATVVETQPELIANNAKILATNSPSDKSIQATGAVKAAPKPPSIAASTAVPVSPAPVGKPAPGTPQSMVLKPGGVSVLLQVSDDGQVQQIFWNQLPAITNAQLLQLEAAIRSRKYDGKRAGKLVTELIDVRQLLNLPPEKPAPVEGALDVKTN